MPGTGIIDAITESVGVQADPYSSRHRRMTQVTFPGDLQAKPSGCHWKIEPHL